MFVHHARACCDLGTFQNIRSRRALQGILTSLATGCAIAGIYAPIPHHLLQKIGFNVFAGMVTGDAASEAVALPFLPARFERGKA